MRAPDVTVIDCSLGNLLSVRRAFEFCGARVMITSDPETICAASHLVLPGVGAFANAMGALQRLGLVEVIRMVAHRGTLILGICLGMQLLMDESEEFTLTAGLGLIPGRVVPVPARDISGEPQKIPHIGWNSLIPAAGGADWNETLLQDITPGESVYFVHSFMAVPSHAAHRLADAQYGHQRLSAAIRRDNITGCQFHPEKSGEVGLRMLRRFVAP